MTLKVLNNAAIIGIGYIVGIRYAAIICAGSFLSYFVLVPIVHAIGSSLETVLAPGTILISDMTQDEVFRAYVRIIGVGGIAGAGILGILSSLPSMVRSIGANLVGMKSQDTRAAEEVPRIDRSLSGTFAIAGLVFFALLAFTFFSFGLGLENAFGYAFVSTLLVMAIAFLFAPVAARAIAIVGTNPVSGMTMLTLIITGFVLLKMGLTGGQGMFVTMMVGGVVCTALAASGALASDLKVGHWIGATPARQLALKFLGTAVAAIFCGLAMWVMAQADPGQGFGSSAIPAPQASAMKEILVGIFGASTSALQWYLFGVGVLLARDPAHGRRAAARLCARHVPADGAQHPRAARRHPLLVGSPPQRYGLRRNRQGANRPRRAHCLGPDGRRRHHGGHRRHRQRHHQGVGRQHRPEGRHPRPLRSRLRGRPGRVPRHHRVGAAVLVHRPLFEESPSGIRVLFSSFFLRGALAGASQKKARKK